MNKNMIIKANGLFEAIMEINLAKTIRPELRVSISRFNKQWKVTIL